MTPPALKSRLDAYWSWLRDQTEARAIEGSPFVEITTPFLDQHNDYLQIYAKPHNGDWYLTDDGYTIHDLAASGCDVSSEKRSKLLQTVLNRLGVEREHDALIVRADEANFPQKKHDLLQAMLAVGDLFHTARATVAGLFLEDVEHWLQKNDIRFTESIKFTGSSGLDHHFDFVIPGYQEVPERIVRALNRPERSNVERLIMAWEDTRRNRPTKAEAVAILNDLDKTVPSGSLQALSSYGIRSIPWSERSEHISTLAE